jgi:TolB-like protein/class 3 adenylate cyclase
LASEKVERRLTAILAADVAGYSRLVAADEERTLAQFAAHVRELVTPQVETHDGRVIKTLGDGVLATFDSVVDALESAVAVQRGMDIRNAEVAPDRRLEFRIGVHCGDVVIRDGDVFGDGVNVAARIEGLAEPGGVCVSSRVQEDTQGRVEVRFEDLGDQDLKNIPRPVRVYKVLLDAMGAPVGAEAPPDAKPSIAVLPFQNMSGDPEQEYFADALTEDLVTALSRWRWFFVIARNSSFAYKGRAVDARRVGRELGVRYLLEGSVRKVGNRVRVTAQLIEAASGNHIWADRFDRELIDILALQDEITERVVQAIEPAMLTSEGIRVARKNLRDFTALDCFQRGMWHLNKVSLDGYREALILFREAIARDPNLALGHIGLSRILYGGAVFGWSPHPEPDLQEARGEALTAISLDPSDAWAHFALSGAALFLGRHDEALEAARRTIALNPNFAFGHHRLGQVLIYVGRPAEAIEHIERSLRHNPFDPQLGGSLGSLALAYYQAKNYEQAIVHAKAAIQNGFPAGHGLLAASLARLGRLQEARNAFPDDMRQRAIHEGARLAAYLNDADRSHLLEGLMLAGAIPGAPAPSPTSPGPRRSPALDGDRPGSGSGTSP